MKQNRDVRIFIIVIPIIFTLLCWFTGWSLGEKELLLGPYSVSQNNAPVYFGIPKLSYLGKIKTYQEGSMYIATSAKNSQKILIRDVPVQQIQEIVKKASSRHSQDGFRLLPYIITAKLEAILKGIPLGWVTILGYLILASMLFSKSGALLFVWWWSCLWLFIGELGLLGSWKLAGQKIPYLASWTGEVLKEFHFMQHSIITIPFLFIFFVITPLVFLMIGLVFITRHILPKRRREIEDFLKYDKDQWKRGELSIENVYFKKLKFDLKTKIDRYKKTNQYFLGLDDQKKDIIMREEMLTHHVHVLGPTGCGKTSQVILPLALQVLEKGRGACFIDFKGDDVLRKTIYQKAKEKGKNLYYFSIDPGEPSEVYNPLSSGDVHSKVDRIMSALELIYKGPAGFYSNVQAMTFISLLKEMIEDGQKITFQSVKEALEDLGFLRRIRVDEKEVKGLVAVLTKLADYPILNNNGLDLREIIKNGDVVFFALKSQVNTQLAEAIGRMITVDLKYQAVFRNETDPPFVIVIDEFQTLASDHFVDVISKVRSANFCLILSNQSRGNLLAVSEAFENTVFTNTATKIIFTQENPQDARFWAEKTGTTQYEQRGMRQFSGRAVGGDSTLLDGKREAEANIHTLNKNYISENIFLRLPKGKSVVFLRQQIAQLANHEHYHTQEERDRLLQHPFEYKARPIIEDRLSQPQTKPKQRRGTENVYTDPWR